LGRKSGEPRLQAHSFIRALDRLNQRNRVAAFRNNYLFALLRPAKVLSKGFLSSFTPTVLIE
jgi:hypothetical protein